MILEILLMILSQIPAPIVEPDGVPFDPSGHSDIVRRAKFTGTGTTIYE